jgi:hypothetical protein
MKDRVRRIHWLVITTSGLLLAGATMALASISTETKKVSLPADGTTHTATAKCAHGEVTGGGTKLSDDINDFAQGSYPAGDDGWTAAAYRDADHVTTEQFTASARCVTNEKVSSDKGTKALGSNAEARTAVAHCANGTHVAGGGGKLSDDVSDYFSGSYPKGNDAWAAVGHGVGKITSTARCIKGGVTIKRKTTDLENDSDTHRVTAHCPNGMKSTGGGARLNDPFNDFVQGTYPAGPDGWTAAGYGAGKVTAFVVCV